VATALLHCKTNGLNNKRSSYEIWSRC